MTRTLVPLTTPDVSAFAKTLKHLLDGRGAQGKPPPTHVELLNLLARSAGLRNFATLKALTAAAPPSPAGHDAPQPADTAPPAPQDSPAPAFALARKTLQQFDDTGRLLRLPNKLSVQQMAMWAFWTQFAAHRRYTEKEVNAVVNGLHAFGDQATLRRELVNMKLLGRKSDCSEYWKEPQRPAPEVQAFLRAWRAKRSLAGMDRPGP